MLKVLSFILVFFSAFSNPLVEQFKEEILLWPNHVPINDQFYQKVKKLETASIKPKIPKIIHQIWLGSPVPEKFYKAMQSWKSHHPDWTYKLWTDKDIPSFRMENRDLFKAAPNYGMKSDLLRMEILKRYGGLYIDVDQFCIKPHDIFHHICSFYVGNMNEKGLINNNVIGASKNNLFLKDWVKTVRKKFKDKNLVRKGKFKNGVGTTFEMTGPHFLRSLLKRHKYKGYLILEKFFFNPLELISREYIDMSSVQENLKPYSYSVHFHTSSWFEK